MAGLLEALSNKANNTNNGGGGLLASLSANQRTNNSILNASSPVATPTAEASENNGGFFGGLGYLGEKIGLGFLSGIEGIWDYTAGGLAKLFGADDWAEQQFANDWVNYNHADEWYNPSSGWQVAGDVAGGIGTSLPAIVGVGIGAAVAYFSGGSLTPLAAGIISGSIAGLGAAGNATKEAYRETGELGGKEFGYGALTGVTEAGVELLSAGLAKGSGRIVSSIAKSTSKEVAETVAKTGAKSVIRQLGEDFAQEAFEEGLAEILSPVYQRMTYNPDAKNASIQEIGYAALVGGLSGMVMSGSRVTIGAAVNTTQNYISGNNAVKNGTVESIMREGETLANAEAKHQTGYEAFESVKETFEKLRASLATTGGQVTTVQQKMLLGKLKGATTISRILPYVERSARGLVFSADVAAERYSTFGITDANGKPLNFTAEQLLEGVDTELLAKAKEGSLTDKEARTFALSLRKAIQNNPVLSTLAVAEATGQIMLDTRKMAEASLNGQNLANAADLNYLIENGSQEEMDALAEAFGIEDWSKVTIDDFRAKVSEFNASGRISEYAEQSKRVHKAAEQASESAKPLPHLLRRNMTDGVYRYKSNDSAVDMAVIKEGNNYFLYDYEGRHISRALSMQDVNKVLKRFWASGQTVAPTAKSMQNNQETATARATAEIEALAKEVVGENYNKLNEPTKAAIRMTIRQAQAHGLSDVQVRTFAKVAARTGVNIIFDEQKALGDGSYSARDNAIYVNPKNSAERTYEIILGHEMFHAIFADGEKGALSLFLEAKKLIEVDESLVEKAKTQALTEEEAKRFAVFCKDAELLEKAKAGTLTNEDAQKILDNSPGNTTRGRYKNFYAQLGGVSATQANVIAEEEVAARGVEEAFKSEAVWDYILSKEPTFADKVLSFFRQSAREYSELQGMSSQARKLIRQYKKLFDSLSEKHQGTNALALTLEGANAKKITATSTFDENMRVTGDNDEDNETLEGDDGTRLAIKYPSFSEAEITSNMDAIADMEAVATIDASRLEKTGKSPMDTFNEYFNSLGNNIASETFGDIALPKSSAKSEIRHGITAEKIASIEAIPAVIEQGKVIFHKAKEGGVERIVVCAPIKIGEADYYMGVMLQRDARYQRLYLHNVVSVAIEREATSSSKDNLVTTGALEDGNRLSITSIIQKALNVKAEKQKSAKKSAETSSSKRFALTKDAETKEIHGYTLNKDADVNEDLLEELRIYDPSAEVSPDGRITVYHRTSEESAAAIRKTGIMRAKEDALFFSSKSEGYASDYGDTVLTFKIPSTQLRINDIFEGEVHFDMPLKRSANGWSANVKSFLDESSRFALPETDSNGETLTEAQREYFADSKVLDENGNLLALYHGTPKENGEFYVFDNNKAKRKGGFGFASSGKGFYFTTKREAAEIYTRSGGRLLSVYVDIKNPYIVNGDIKEQISNDFGIDPLNVYLQEVRRILSSKGYDGIIQGRGDAQIVVAYYPEQIKLTSNKNPTVDPDVRFALPETAEQEVLEKYGRTFSWNTTGYIFKNGTRLDLSGKSVGAPGGYRALDHRDIFDIYTLNSYTDAMIEFMRRGNVRVVPESPGINLIVEPTEAQYEQITSLVERLGWREKEFRVDFDNENGDTVDSLYYEGNVSARKVVADIRHFFKEGTVPYQSDLSQFRYALTEDENLDDFFAELASFSDSGPAFDIQKVIDRGLPRRPGASTLTVGELKKVIANNTRDKVYSKKNALEIVGRFYGVSDLTAKTRGEIADALWQGLNDCTDAEERATFAHDMAEFIVAKMLTEAKVENPDIIEAQEKLTYLSTYIGKLTFSPQDISELRHIADKDGLRRLLGRWGYKGRKISLGNGTATVARATPMDVFVCDIAREMPGMADFEDMHPAEAFIELDAIYERAKEDVKDKWVSAYWDMPDSDIPAMVQGVEEEILKAFMTDGAKSKFAKLVEGKIESAQRRADFWKAEHDSIKGRDRLLGFLMAQAQKMNDLRIGKYKNSTQFESELFRNSIEKLAKIKFRGNLNVSGTRGIFSDLLLWYQGSKTTLLEYVDAENPGYYSEAIEEALRTIAEGKGGFTKADLSTMIDVMGHFIHFVENYGKVWRSGQMVEALPLAQEFNRIIERNKTLKVGLFGKLAGSWYAELFLDPQALCERMDYYDHGFFTQMFEELRAAARGAEVAEMDIMSEYDAFLRENKKYIANISTETVEYRGHQIPKAQLIDLYMTMKRKQAWAGAAYNGFNFKNLKGDVERVDGFLTAEVETEEELEAAIQAELDAIAKNFTDTDRAYMAIVERGYNERAKALKVERDMARMGYTNASDGYYYPISRAYTSKTIDADPIKAEFDRVSNASFNKDIVKGARQELALSSVDARYRRHIHAVCQYAYLQPAIETFNRLYNLDISGNKNHPVSVRTASENVWKKGNLYFKKLISDIQGIPTGSSEGMAALAFIRGSYAKYQLGANPKVWFTQLSSIFASTSILDYDCIIRGMGVSSSDIDTYCPLARLRNYDNTAAMAQGVLDRSGKAYGRTGKVMNKVGEVSDLLMKPIGMMDRFVVSRLFGACQVQVEKNGGAKVGTEENKIEAGKLLEKVIFETQQNSIATERSGAMRSSNEILRTLTMFTSDSMKVIGRVISAYGEVSVLKARIKAETDADAKAELQARLKKAQKKLAKSSAALAMTAIFMALIAQAFRWLYKKDDEEDNIPLNMTLDAVGNLFGGLPLVKDAYAKLVEGYDLDNYAYSAVNDLLDGAKNLMTTAGNVFSNEASSQEVALGIKNFIYSVGQATGIPVRNIYNVFYGLTKRFNGQAAYKIDNVFYEKNYKNDFYKAIESGDAEMATFIMSLLYNERMGENMSATTHSELYSLSAKGFKVIPKSAASSITIDGQEYELSEAEIAAVRANYSTAQSGLEKLFANASYSALTDELKADAVNYLYDLYYDQAIEETLGVDRGNGALIAKAVGADTLALLYVATKGLESDKDKNGNTVSGSKRKKVLAAIKKLNIPTQQKLLLLCAKGYSIQDGDIKGCSAEKAKKYLLNYLLRLTSLTKEQKAELAVLCGFEVKNGKIVQKTSTK